MISILTTIVAFFVLAFIAIALALFHPIFRHNLWLAVMTRIRK